MPPKKSAATGGSKSSKIDAASIVAGEIVTNSGGVPTATIAGSADQAASTETAEIVTNSGGVPTATIIASADNAGEVGGVPTSKPEEIGTASGTNTSEGDATGGAGDLASPAASAIDGPAPASTVALLNQLANFAERVDPERHVRVVWLFNSDKFPLESPPSAIRVTSAIDGFRRAGMRHSAEPQEYPLDHFNPDQLEMMLGETMLTVELI